MKAIRFWLWIFWIILGWGNLNGLYGEIVASQGDTLIVEWNHENVRSVEKFRLYFSEVTDSTGILVYYDIINFVTMDDTTFHDMQSIDLPVGFYNVYLTAINGGGESDMSNKVRLQVIAAVPGPPHIIQIYLRKSE